MKHHLLRLTALFLLAIPALHAQMHPKKIIISSLGTPQKAERALKRLERYLDAHPDILALLDTNGIAMHSRPSGKYFIVVIEPFTDKENLIKVKSRLKDRYPTLFVNNYAPESDIIVSEAPQKPKVIIKDEVAIDMVVEEVPESLVVIKETADSKPRVIAAEKVEVPKVIAIDKKTLEEDENSSASSIIEEAIKEVKEEVLQAKEHTAQNLTAAKESIQEELKQSAQKASEAATETTKKIQESMHKTTEQAAELQEQVKEEVPHLIETAKQSIQEGANQTVKKVHQTAEALSNHTATATAITSTTDTKEKFISHNPDHQTESHNSMFPPWWVLLSVLALILSPIGSYIESRNNKLYR